MRPIRDTLRCLAAAVAACGMLLAPEAGAFTPRHNHQGTTCAALLRQTGAKEASCPFRYSTKYRDPDLALYYYGYRWYDAAALKWLTPDPLGERGGVNLTAFCDGDPINKVDPLGLEEFEIVGKVPRTVEATQVLQQYVSPFEELVGFRVDPGVNAGRGARYIFLPAAYLEPGILREEAARGDPKSYREATEQEYTWFFLALLEQNLRDNPKLSPDLQTVMGHGYRADPLAFASDLGRIWRAYHRGETSQLVIEEAGQQLVFSALFAGLGYSVRQAKAAAKSPVVIGETTSRVEAAAAKYPGAKILNDMPDFKAMGMNADQVTSAMMPYNRKRMLEQMRSGRQIIDIGADANRATPSISYQMEQNMLRNYQKLHPEFPGAVSP